MPIHGRAVLAVALLAVAACASDPKPSSIDAATHAQKWERWRDDRVKWLATPGRPMSYTSLTWLPQGSTSIGGDSTNRVRLSGRDVPPAVGVLVREGVRVRFEPAAVASGRVTVDSLPAVAGWVRTDADSGGASRIEAGSAGFRVMRRQDSIGVRTWDADRAQASAIAPLAYFPLDSAWRVGGRLIPAAKPETIAVPTTAGVGEVHIIVGVVRATLGGKRHDLTAFAGNAPTDLYFSFSDETSGEETYGFRFLHAPFDPLTNIVTLDFNFAYNPDCAFSSFTTCPLPPLENRVPVRITAGEKAVEHLDPTRKKTVLPVAARP